MRRVLLVFGTAIALAVGLLSVPTAAGSSPGASRSAAPEGAPSDALEVYVGQLDAAQLEQLHEAGIDRDEAVIGPSRSGKARVEVIATPAQARALRAKGVDLSVKRVGGKAASAALAEQAADGYEVWRSYGGPGGLREEMVRLARAYRPLAKLVSVGTSLEGRPIFGLKVTKNATRVRDGQRPSVLYTGAQHAREWITPEHVSRLMRHVLDGYGNDPEITELVDTTELWFVPVQNPDGYDFTFTEGNRLWRKNTRDNNGDGEITSGDGVDLNRNSPYKWGYDNEGSAAQEADETYRGAAPASEPETRAMLRLIERVGFEYLINYHSAAELILYGAGWQVSTPTPDDVIYEALAGTDDNPAVPGYDPDISAELYTTNGDFDSHAHEELGTLGFTPEMSTCQSASASDPNDEWEPEDCVSSFIFPDDEELVQAEFEKNIPFALSVAKSTHDPDDPESSVGLEAADMVVDTFDVSYGGEQAVALTAKRDLRNLRMRYRLNDGAVQRSSVAEWGGGERYGAEQDVYYAEYRGTVSGAGPGDDVTVWFDGNKPGEGRVTSERFTYEVAEQAGSDADVLILAAEDYTGAVPEQDDGPQYVDEYAAALDAAGYSSDVYDVDAHDRSAPHPLGVLSHYDAVVWETGEDIIPRHEGQPVGTAAKYALDLELAVRDYLNEGGRLLLSGKYALLAQAADGAYYYNPFEEEQGACQEAGAYPCLALFNDFTQYWLGAYQYVDGGGHDDAGAAFPLAGGEDTVFDGWTGALNTGDSAGNQDHSAAFVTTSSFLPPEEFPQFASAAPVLWDRGGANPYDPVTGDWYVFSQQADRSYKRLTHQVDLTGASDGELTFQVSAATEANWDHMFVEARTVGADDWTTLPDANGHTTQETGLSCESGWHDEIHPHLQHYMNAECDPTGTTGEWHALSGSTNGWQEWSIDLSRYAGEQVEVSIVYASDWATQGIGVFLDDAAVSVDGAVVSETSFEDDFGAWEVSGPPAGSPPNANDWERNMSAIEEGAVVATDATLYTGFGMEGLPSGERDDFMTRAMEHLLGP